jgi:hypothetical protein
LPSIADTRECQDAFLISAAGGCMFTTATPGVPLARFRDKGNVMVVVEQRHRCDGDSPLTVNTTARPRMHSCPSEFGKKTIAEIVRDHARFLIAESNRFLTDLETGCFFIGCL